MADETATPKCQRDAMNGWIERVLGVRVPTAANASTEWQPVFPVMRLSRARQQWIAARQQAVTQITRLQDALTIKFEDDPEQQTILDQAQQKLASIARAFDATLEIEAEALLGEEDAAERRARAQSLQTIAAGLKALIESDAVIAELDGNEIVPEMVIVAPLLRSLDEVCAAIN